MSHQAPLQPGDPRRVGRYRLAGRITGIPADGPIYLGAGPGGAEIMISMVPGDWTRDSAARDRFAAEAAVARRVPPFCAARILDAGIDGDRAYLVSEYVPGESLLELVSAGGVLPEGEIEAVAIGMVTGLTAIHQAGLIHGSFGPEFVVMTDAGPRVVEFAITPPYGIATPSADMVAWARTVVFAATGKPPATMADLEVLPYYVRDVVAACLNPDPSERPTARSAVLELLGDHDPPAGVLAEGSRRSAPGVAVASQIRVLAEAGRTTSAAPAPERQARSGSRTTAASSSRQLATVPRQASRRTRPAAEMAAPPAAFPDGGGYREQPGRVRNLVLLGAGIFAACAVVVVVAIELLHGGAGNPVALRTPRSSPTADGSARSPLASSPPIQGLNAPGEFTGRWSGQMRQPTTSTIVQVALNLAARGGTGTVSYSYNSNGLKQCTASLTVTNVTTSVLVLRQIPYPGQGCLAGTVTLTLTGPGSIQYVFQGNGLPAKGHVTKG